MEKISPFGIFSESYASTLRWARYFLPVAAVPSIIAAVMNSSLMEMMYPGEALPPGQLPEGFWSMWALMMVVIMTLQILQLSLFSAVMEGREDWLKFGLLRGVRRLLPLMIGLVIYFLAYFAGMILLIIPGLMAAVLLSMMLPLVLLDDMNPFAAVGKSWRMTWGNAWRFVGAGILVFLPVAVVFWPVGSALGFLSLDPQMATVAVPTWTDWQTWVWAALTTVSGALMTTFYLVMYRALKTAGPDDSQVVTEAVAA